MTEPDGIWIECGTVKVHLSGNAGLSPMKSAHRTLVLSQLANLARELEAAGVPVERDVEMPGQDRLHTQDPFGNRLELLQPRLDPAGVPEFRISSSHVVSLPSVDDASELFELQDQNRARLRAWLPWLDQSQGPADTARMILKGLDQYSRNQGFHAVIRVDGRLAGVVGFHAVDWVHRATSIGYWLGQEFEGRGLMTRSCSALLDHAFRVWNLNRVVIRCATENRRSRAIPERLGFQVEGTRREAEWLYDHFVDLVEYSLLRSEWNSNCGSVRQGDSA